MMGRVMQSLGGGQTQTLEQLLSEAIQTPSHGWQKFVDNWKYSSVCRMLSKYRSQLDSVLSSMLDAKKHTVVFAYILGFKSGDNKLLDDPSSLAAFFNQLRHFMEKCDMNQVSLCARAVTDALRVYVEYLKRENMVALIGDLKRYIRVLQGGKEHLLTYAHCELARCCVESYMYHLAFPEVSRDLTQVQGDNSVKPSDNLSYHYYVALVYIGTKDYPKALEYLTLVLTAPSECLSVIQLEAFKKHVLLSLVLRQQMIQLPRYTPNMLKRYYRKFCHEYIQIAEAFPKGSEEMARVVEKHAEIFMKDYNFGLVKQVMKTVEKHAVRKLTSVYTRLSIEKVAELCRFPSVDNTKRLLLSMIRNNELAATFDAEGVVQFEEEVTETDAAMLEKIHSRVKGLVKMWEELDNTQLSVKQSEKFIKKKLNLDRGMGGMGGMGEDMLQQMMMEQAMGGGLGGLYRG